MPDRKLSLTILSALSFTVIFLLAIAPVYACSPTPTPSTFTFEDRVNDAEIIVVGTIVQGNAGESDIYSYITQGDIEVETYLKGEGSELIHITGFGFGTDCRPIGHVGRRYIFFLEFDTTQTTHLLYLIDPYTTWMNPKTVEDITNITNQVIEPSPSSVHNQLQSSLLVYGILTISIIGLVTMAVYFIFSIRTNKRKHKVKNS